MLRIDSLIAIRASIFVALTAVFGVFATAQLPPEPIQVKVHNQVLHRIDERLFGQFMERASWGGEIGAEAAVIPGTHRLRPQVKHLLRQMQIPIVRFPGGTDADYIDWRDMIDNVPGRNGGRPVTTGHTGNRVTNNFGYDEFLRLCEELAMEAILVVNFRDGLLDEDGPQRAARHAARLVAYCNAASDANLPEDLAVWPQLREANGHRRPYGVKYVQIGNETWAFSRDVGHEHYLEAVDAYVEAIRSVDPSVRIIVDGQPEPLAAKLHKRFGDRIDYFAVHHYQPWQIRSILRDGKPVEAANLTEKDIWYAWVTVPQIDAAGRSCLQRSELQQARELGYRVAMTEWNWNGWWADSLREQAALDSLYARGVGAAGLLHAIMRRGDVVDLATQSMLVGDGWRIHAIWCDRDGKRPPFMVPSGQVTALYSRYHGSERLRIDVAHMPRYDQPYRMAGIGPAQNVACVDLLATRDEDTCYLHAINRHFDEPQTVSLDLSALERRPSGTAKLHILEGRLENTPAASEELAPAQVRDETLSVTGDRFAVRLPRRSVTVVEVPLVQSRSDHSARPAGRSSQRKTRESSQARLAPGRLRCEHLENPLGIDVPQPRLSWQLKARPDQRDERQTAWRIIVASSPEKLDRDEGDLWDSGKVDSDQSVLVPYQGKPLHSRSRCWWKVMVWGAQGQAGPWSAAAFWEMALLNSDDWQARWIASSAAESSPPPREPAPLFRQKFEVTGDVSRARAYVTGLGYFELSLNGRKVGDHALDPVKSRYDRRVYYVTFDIRDQLRQGDNAVGMMLGTGWFNMHTKAVWGFGQAPWRARPRALCQIEIEYADGRVQHIVSDGKWRVGTGPIVFDGIRNGETYDARLERPGWDRPEFDDSDWQTAAEVAGPGGVLSAQMLPPIRATAVLKPESVEQVKPDVWVYDFGQNLAGRLRLSVRAPAGTKISLKQGERRYPDGTVEQKQIARFIKSGELQTDTYICKGSGLEVWEPRFVYHGFQYVEVRGLSQTPTLDLLQAKVLHTDFESAGSFRCSKELLNRIQQCTRWSFIGNYHGIPTDCPHREKIGWTGDAHLVGETGLLNYDMAASYTKWLRDFADEQRADGDLPGVVPTSGWGYLHGKPPYRALGYGPQWEGAYVILAWYVHLYTGDTRILEQNYAGFRRYLDHLTRHAEDGLIRFGIDDHAPARTKTPPADFATGFYFQIARIVSRTAALLGKSADAEHYAGLSDSIRAAYNRELFSPDTGRYGSGSQTAQSAPLYFGIVEPQQRDRVLAKLVANVEHQNNHLDTGVVGTRFLLNGLARHGRADVAYRIVTRTTFPSWGDWIRKGANTLWQKWDDSMSRNHVMFGDVSAWMFKHIGGLQADPAAPGFKHFFIRPEFFPDLEWAEVEHQSPYGRIHCAWRRVGDRLELALSVPVNSSATLLLPTEPGRIREGGQPLSRADGIRGLRTEGESTAIHLGSGRYRLEW